MSIVKSYSFPDGEIRGDMYYIKHGTNNFNRRPRSDLLYM